MSADSTNTYLGSGTGSSVMSGGNSCIYGYTNFYLISISSDGISGKNSASNSVSRAIKVDYMFSI